MSDRSSSCGPSSGRDQPAAHLRLCADGPMLVRGAATVTDADGVDHAVERPVVAVCMCGATGRAPWCDGTHARLGRGRRPRA